MNKIHFWEKFAKYIEKIENSSVSLYFCLIQLSIIFFLRSFFELILTLDVPSGSEIKVFLSHYFYSRLLWHYLLFYFSIFLTLFLIFALSTKEKINKILKVLCLHSWIIFLPLFELFYVNLFTDNSLILTYLSTGSFKEIVAKFFLFSGATNLVMGNIMTGISFFMKIEVASILLFSYLYFKIKKVKFACLYTLIVYLIFFVYSLTPLFLNIFAKLLNIGISADDNLYCSVYIVMISVQLFLCTWFICRYKIYLLLKDLRILKILHYLFLFFWGFWIAPKSKLALNTVIDLLALSFSIIFTGFFVNINNNIEDIKIDKISNKNRILPLNLIDVSSYKKIMGMFFFLAVSLAFVVSDVSMLFILSIMGLYFLYSSPPFRLKRFLFLSKFIIAINTLLIIMFGYIQASPSNFQNFPSNLVYLILIGFTLVLNFMDIKDYKGDKNYNICTLPVLLGEKKAKYIIAIFFFFLYFWVIYKLNFSYKSFLLLIILFFQLYAILKKKFNENIVILLGLLSYPFIFL